MKRIDFSGKQFGKLTALRFSHNNGNTYWLFKCDCGNEKVIRVQHVKNKKIISCGCLPNPTTFKKCHKHNITHGESNTRLYEIYSHMKGRCYNKNHDAFRVWGGKGIIICKQWLDDFLVFKKWALENKYTDKKVIHRINPNFNYEPNNCIWVTPTEHISIHHMLKKVDPK